MPRSEALGAIAALCLWAGAAFGAPDRVVSLNVCTDQLAWLLAPEQLVSVSRLAHDPRVSAYAGAMQDVPSTSGAAEEVVLLKPDLVLAGTYTTRATVEMLERLGIPVVQFAPINSLKDAAENMRRMGEVLGVPRAGAEMAEAFEARAEAMRKSPEDGPRAILYHAQGRSSGDGSLAGDVLRHVGFRNIASEIGLPPGGKLPLEELILSDPDIVLVSAPYDGFAWATELTRHPALAEGGALREVRDGARWTCETPALLDALRDMAALRYWTAR